MIDKELVQTGNMINLFMKSAGEKNFKGNTCYADSCDVLQKVYMPRNWVQEATAKDISGKILAQRSSKLMVLHDRQSVRHAIEAMGYEALPPKISDQLRTYNKIK